VQNNLDNLGVLRCGVSRALVERLAHVGRVSELLHDPVPLCQSRARRPRSDRPTPKRALERGHYAPGELVFATPRRTPLHPPNLYRRVWQPALERAGVADEAYRFHDLRNTCVSRLVAAGADIKLVQAVAGHANLLITLKRYSHLLDGRITEAANRFDPARTP